MKRSAILGFCLFISLAIAAGNDFDMAIAGGTAYLRQGQYHLALDTFETAQRLAVRPRQQMQAMGWLGLTHYRMRHFEQADDLLKKALAPGTADPHDRARWTAALADLQANRRQPDEARRLYQEALKLAAGDSDLTAGIRLGQVALLPSEQRLAELQDIANGLRENGRPEDRARYLINIGTQARGLGEYGEKLAYDSFEQASRSSGSQPRTQAEALGGLAQLYENRKRPQEALRLDREAIRSAEAVGARDLLVELEWRAGRLQRMLQRPTDALAAYQRALEHIEAIRQDIPVEYHDGRSSFRETLEPFYLELADLFFDQANRLTGTADEAQLLRRARSTVELIKQSELEDFLGSRCAVQPTKTALLESVESRTAILYPIIFPDRLELLVSTGNELRHYSQSVNAATVQRTAQKLASALRDKKSEAREISEQLYRWLIAPAEPWLRQRQVQTLVIVPDGVLRLLPLGALYDGAHYLIERYAVATSPGLTLLEPVPLQQRGISVLLAGMSQPGPVVDHLPPAFFQDMLSASGQRRGIGSTGQPNRRATWDNLTAGGEAPGTNQDQDAEIERLRHDPDFQRGLNERLVLPGVDREIASLERKVTNKVLINREFTVENFKQEVTRNAYSVIHIASHGVFGHNAETSFVMAHDGVIDIDELERLFKSEKFEKNPVELLTLSACQTAEGDDRAPLGLSGIALKAKVRSALGTLWPVSDEAAASLMVEFYQALSQPDTSKVQALRRAQQAMMANPRFAHPFYWGPFILVGNWL